MPIKRVWFCGQVTILLFVVAFDSGCAKRREARLQVEAENAARAAAEAEARDLTAELERETDDERRIELVFALAANATAIAQDELRSCYHDPQRSKLKIDIVRALPLLESGGLEFPLELLRDAIAPTQPPELREAAIDTLRDLNDPRTVPLWQTLAKDRDAEIRETATSALDYFKTLDEP